MSEFFACGIAQTWPGVLGAMAAYQIELNDLDLGQLLDGLRIRAKSWERTADYLRTEKMPEGEFFIIEECSKPQEADDIAAHYRSIIEKIERQMEAQE